MKTNRFRTDGGGYASRSTRAPERNIEQGESSTGGRSRFQGAVGIHSASRARYKPHSPRRQGSRINWRGAAATAAPARRAQFINSMQDLSKALVPNDCTLHLLQCAIIFKRLSKERSDGVHPSVDDLKLLHEKFDRIWANTHERNRNAATLAQWSSLFDICGHLPSHQEMLDLLLKKTAALLDSMPSNAQAIGSILYNLNKMTSGEGTEAVLKAVARHIENVEKLDHKHISMALYGLQNMTECDGTKAVLKAMMRHIENAKQLDSQAIGNALYGLQNMRSSKETRALLKAMVRHIENAEQLKPQEIGMALYGLQNMAQSEETEAVLKAMARHIESAKQLDSQAIGNVLYGLQNMTPNDGTEAVLNAMVRHIENAKQLEQKHIGNALYGLQNMVQSDGTEAVLNAMVRHIENAKQLDSQAIGMGLYGLQNMVQSDGTKAVLKAMVRHIENAKWLDAQAIGNALYGLQNVRPSKETEAVLKAMVRQIENVDRLNPKAIFMALCGLRNLGKSANAKAVLAAMTPHVLEMDLHGRSGSGSAARYLAEIIHSLEPHFTGKEEGGVAERLLAAMHQRLGIRLPEGALADPKSRRHAIFTLLRQDGHIYASRRSRNSQEEWAIDLHHLSHALGAAFCEIALQSLNLEIALPINIVYGRSSHRESNQGKMRAAVESVLAKREFNKLAIDDSQDGYICVIRDTSGANKRARHC